mgnify:CR=1 FL=1
MKQGESQQEQGKDINEKGEQAAAETKDNVQKQPTKIVVH